MLKKLVNEAFFTLSITATGPILIFGRQTIRVSRDSLSERVSYPAEGRWGSVSEREGKI